MKRLTCILLVLVMMMGAMALAEGDAPIEISTVEELAAINDNLSGNYVLTADIDLGARATPSPISSSISPRRGRRACSDAPPTRR